MNTAAAVTDPLRATRGRVAVERADMPRTENAAIAFCSWPEVLAQLRGPRLAVYDDLLRGGPGVVTDQLESVQWLFRHRFVWCDAAGSWHARPPEVAQQMFERTRT